MGGDAEIHLLLCATYAVGGDIEAARLARAHVTEAERADPANTVALAACAAALGETRAAIAELEMLALHPGRGRSDRFALRDLYLANDWDRLRGDPASRACFRADRRARDRPRVQSSSSVFVRDPDAARLLPPSISTPVSKVDAVAGSQRDSTSAAAAPCLNSRVG